MNGGGCGSFARTHWVDLVACVGRDAIRKWCVRGTEARSKGVDSSPWLDVFYSLRHSFLFASTYNELHTHKPVADAAAADNEHRNAELDWRHPDDLCVVWRVLCVSSSRRGRQAVV